MNRIARLIVLGLGIVFLMAIQACGSDATATPASPARDTSAPTSAPVATAAATRAPAATAMPTEAPAPATAPTEAPAPTVAPTEAPAMAAMPKVKRLIVAAGMEREGSDPTTMVLQFAFQNAPMYEGLSWIANDGNYEPMLASWEFSEDLTTWTWHLRDDVIWHRDFGDFTARDLLHSIDQRIKEESVSPNLNKFKALVESGGVNVVDDHTVIYTGDATLDWWAIETNDAYHSILSQAHFDAEGQDGLDNSPVGTGPYQFVERVLGSHVLYERVAYDHWRVNPDFEELMILKVGENSTRLAMLLTEEAHIASLPGDLEPVAVAGGMEIIEASLPSTPVYTMFGGAFHPDGIIREGSIRKGTSPDLPYSDIFHPVTEVPWADIRVRKALNHAVDRNTIRDTILRGRGEPMAVTFFHDTLPGWNQDWIDSYEEHYGYDPDLARQLLAEVEAEIGQPLDWSQVIFLLTARPELPELLDIGEAVNNYWREVGADVELVTGEFSEWASHFFTVTIGGVAWTDASRRFLDPQMLRNIYYSRNNLCCHFYENDELDAAYERLVDSTLPADRERFMQEGGNVLYDNYATLPMFWLSVRFAVNPEVVADYVTSGNRPPRDFEFVKAVR
jgi:peptide/nickel transport system substrate-binding protein